jgi:hypothetical protein
MKDCLIKVTGQQINIYLTPSVISPIAVEHPSITELGAMKLFI